MSYAKAIKWAKTHRKGISNLYMGFDTGASIKEPQLSTAQLKEREIISFKSILNEIQEKDIYPVYIAENRSFWFITNERNIFGSKIDSFEELMKYYNNYIKDSSIERNIRNEA